MPSYLRPSAVAGLFYPSDAVTLTTTVHELLGAATQSGPRPKALIAPHAGYVYSGPVAASAYALLAPLREQIERVVLLGPSHYVPFHGLAASSAAAFETPLGAVKVDIDLRDQLLELPEVVLLDAAHEREHSLEVHLPFLQSVLASFRLLPLTVGEASPDEVARVLERAWGDQDSLIVVSSDLSHYHDYTTARQLDEETRRRIEGLAAGGVETDQACGSRAVNGLLEVARRRGLEPSTLDLRNSGDTAGRRDSVVGYGAWAFSAPGLATDNAGQPDP